MKTNKEVWIKRFQEWENSGLTRASYCRKHQIPISTFDYWRHRIRKESSKKDRDSGIVKLPFLISQRKPLHFTFEYPSGYKLYIPSDYSSWMSKVYLTFQFLEELFKKKIKEGPVIQMDETTVQVLNEPERPDTCKSQMWQVTTFGCCSPMPEGSSWRQPEYQKSLAAPKSP